MESWLTRHPTATVLNMSRLAILGGPPAAAHLTQPQWPPRSKATAQKLQELYWSGNWSFDMDGQESALCREFADAHDALYGIFMANGTVTMQCSLAACGIGAGDEVVLPALTCTTSVMPIVNVGATAVFADVEPTTLCLDPIRLEEVITSNTRAILPVHLYGSMVDMDAVLAIAHRHEFAVIEDAAHVHGGKWDGRGIGSLGHVGSFSFQQKKPISAGEGGMCITNDALIAEKIHRMMHIGYAQGEYSTRAKSKFRHEVPYSNLSATEFQAMIARAQLAVFDQQIATYAASAKQLTASLGNVPGVRVQSVGRLADPQTYNKFLLLFDEPPLDDIPIRIIIDALRAEGLPFTATFGTVYDHPHFNCNERQYRIPSSGCRVSREIGELRGCVLDHPWLSGSTETVNTIADAVTKVALNHAGLRQLHRTAR